MKKRRHELRPVVECCETRALLSAGLIAPAAVSLVATPPIERLVHLDGVFRGHYMKDRGIPDVGTPFDLTGSGHVTGIKPALVAGHFLTDGFIENGHAEGELFLSGAQGTITLQLTGPEQSNGSEGLPDHFTYKIVGGTGKYAHEVDNGVASLVLIPGHSTTHSGHPGKGTFTLVLTSESGPGV